MNLRLRAYGSTSVGLVREANEDSYYVGTTVFAVADGMGGHAAGEVASAAALEPVERLDGQEFDDPEEANEALAHAVVLANDLVYGRAVDDPELRGMGTTLTAVMVRDGKLHLAHVGDSRAYLLRGGVLERLTEDHTLVQQLVNEGRLTAEQAAIHPQRSVITRAIGVDRDVEVDSIEPALELMPGDQILLCSDGLTGPVSEAQLAEILASERDGEVACQRLLDAANAGGGPDNITVVLLRAEGDEDAPAAPPPTPALATDDDEATADLSEAAATFDARRLTELSNGTVDDTPPEVTRSRRSRVLSALLAVLLIVVVVGGGGLLLLSRAYYVGVADGDVAVFRGIQGDILGIELATLVHRSDVRVADLPEVLQETLEDGVTFGSEGDARTYITQTLVPEVADPDGEPTGEPTDEASEAPSEAPAAAPEPPTTDPRPTLSAPAPPAAPEAAAPGDLPDGKATPALNPVGGAGSGG